MLKSINGLAIVTALLGLALGVPARSQDGKAPNPGKEADLVGTYQVVAMEREGQPVAADHFRGDTVKITRDKITTFDMDNNKILDATYKVDTSTTPWKITTVTVIPIKDMKSSGLIERKGDTIRLVCNMAGGPEPTAFKTGPNQQMFVLKSVSQ